MDLTQSRIIRLTFEVWYGKSTRQSILVLDEGCSKRISDYRGVPGIFVEIFVARTSSLVDFKIDSLSHGRCNQRMFGVIQMKYSFDRFGRKYSQRISD